jgi:hypothetical protein
MFNIDILHQGKKLDFIAECFIGVAAFFIPNLTVKEYIAD